MERKKNIGKELDGIPIPCEVPLTLKVKWNIDSWGNQIKGKMKVEKYNKKRAVDTQNIHTVYSFPRGHIVCSELLSFSNKKGIVMWFWAHTVNIRQLCGTDISFWYWDKMVRNLSYECL